MKILYNIKKLMSILVKINTFTKNLYPELLFIDRKVMRIMDYRTKRNGYLAALIILAIAIVLAAVYVALQGSKIPNGNGGAVLNANGGTDGKLSITDVNDGQMTIPKYNVPVNQYDNKKFTESSNVFSYNNSSVLGITVRSKSDGDGIDWANVDWQKVKDSGVKFVMIRVGFRDYESGSIHPDQYFTQNIQGASAVGLDVGVYFYSAAKSTLEAEEEATYVLTQIKDYQITYPVVFYWEFVTGVNDESTARTKNCTPTEITSFTEAFCKKIKMAKYTAAFFTDKNMGYEYFNLETLKDYDIWYTEYQPTPAFYYNFQMWQYTAEGEVPGINGKVKMTIALKKYGS